MNFRVGQKVVCFDATPARLGGLDGGMPIKGQVYTVTAVGLINPNDPKQLPCILVAEIDRDVFEGLWAHRFRPAVERKTDISIFTKILDDVNRKIPTEICT